MEKLSIPDNKPNKLFMKNTLKYNKLMHEDAFIILYSVMS